MAAQETSDEVDFRKQHNFPAVESQLEMHTKAPSLPILDNISSYLGAKNPLARPIDPRTGHVWLFDATANHPTERDGDINVWHAELVAAYFENKSGKEISDAVANVVKAIGLAKGDKAEATIEQRLRPFFDQIKPARYCHVDIEGARNPTRKLGPSSRDGISNTPIQWQGQHTDGSFGQLKITGGVPSTGGQVTYAAAEGWAIISDIDDTIKRTLTMDPVGILKTTFVDEPQPIEGMPELYWHMSERLQQPPFWYLSASPYNLYPFLRSFRDAHFPAGTIVLRENSWMNIAGFLSSVTRGTQAYKVNAMMEIYKTFPRRRLICLGDSTQSDPEAYAEIYRHDPNWIKAIFIRKVQNVTEITDVATPGDDEKKRNAPERFEKAFEGVPKDVWHVFDKADELYAKVDGLVAAHT